MNALSEVLIVCAFVFMVLESLTVTGGVFAAAGVLLFAVGTVILYSISTVLPFVFVYVVLPVFLALSLLVLVLAVLGFRAHKHRVIIGDMVGKKGVCVKPIKPGIYGQVDIDGELWKAFSSKSVGRGEHVVVVEQDSLKLKVESLEKRS